MSEDKPIEVDAVPTQAVAVRPPAGELQQQSISDLEHAFALAVRQRELLSEYIKQQLKPGKHFYEVKGSDKKSLTKEGAEIILLPHGFIPDYNIVSGPSEPPEDNKPYQITVKCSLRRKGDPNSFVGSGIGSAGSHHGFWDKEARKWSYKPRQPDKYLCHNATLKMAQKSAMIAATINATAASEFFTQDMSPDETGPQSNGKGPTTNQPEKPAQSHTPVAKSASAQTPAKIPASAENCRTKFAANMDEGKLRQKATQFLIDLGWLLPTETLENMELRYVPQTKEQYVAFLAKLTAYAASGKSQMPYEPGPIGEQKPWDKGTKPPKSESLPASGTTPTPTQASATTNDAVDQPWYKIIVPIPRKGMKRNDYLKHPDTIGSLFEARHGSDDESQMMRQRLWGFLNNWEPTIWKGKDGKERPPSQTDVKFREALDSFGDWFEKNHPGEEL